jgi:antagonist of KipI
MAMEVIKSGILDTLQDEGRKGFAHLGIGLGGCMDNLAGIVANLLAGNSNDLAVLEMHFPAPVLLFPKGAIIALSGADFGARANGISLPVNRRVELPHGAILDFTRKSWGQRCYLAVAGGWKLDQVMGSYSTHLKAGFGGWKGRTLKKGDFIPLKKSVSVHSTEVKIAKWFVYPHSFYSSGSVRVIPGPEWDWLDYHGQKQLLNDVYTISLQSDRMGYQLKGTCLEKAKKGELLSSGVLPGTIQLLPGGIPLLLMADCQTTGGYPRILQVAAVDLPKLAQMGAGESITFSIISVEESINLSYECTKQMEALKGAIPLK